MVIKPHDLLKLNEGLSFLENGPFPGWARESVIKTPFVVVRRSPVTADKIPIGIRGKFRSQRFAAHIHQNEVEEVISPEKLVRQKRWHENCRTDAIQVMKAIQRVDEMAGAYQLDWGPTGSAGFELASDFPAVMIKSDLDLLIRVPDPVSVETLRRLSSDLDSLGVRTDCQLETSAGAVSLAEFSRGEKPLLLRTINGPVLVHDPWHYPDSC
ncbi:MAG: malonate decarboxylase holo-ACP synthase [Balneolaceae bacterium]